MLAEVGLRIDVCTSEGLRAGVPNLLDLLKRLKRRATFFVAMGPDRSGMALLRVFKRRGFLSKMVRTGAVKMYGLRTMMSGTLLPAPLTGASRPETLKRIVAEGHELGIHGWDHVLWHDHVQEMSREAIARHLHRAIEAFEEIVGRKPTCTAAPGWLCSETSLAAQESMGFAFGSDTRGHGPFLPRVGDRVLTTPQIPVTLPTLDEVLGRDGLDVEGYAAMILKSLTGTQVLTMHAEAEGRAYLTDAENLLKRMEGIRPLGELSALRGTLTPASVRVGSIQGRATPVTFQG